MSRVNGIYRNSKTYPIPNLDLLTFIFNSPHSTSLEDSILHASATTPSICLNKAGLRRLSEEFAYGLRHRFDVGKNGPGQDVVVIFSSGQPAYPAAFFGVIAAGGVASMASPSSTASELARQIRAGDCNLLICSEDFVPVAKQALTIMTEQKVTLLVLSSEPDWSLRVHGQGFEGELRGTTLQERLEWEKITDPEKLKKSLIILLYSSGTTGIPKGVMLSHLNFVSQLIILISPSREHVAKQVEQGAVFPPSRTLAHLPAAHIAGVMSYLMAPVFGGGLVFWMRKYNWKDFMEFNRSLRITSIYTVPSIYLRIAKDPAVTDHFKTLVYASAGAAPMDSKLQQAANKKIGSGETHISQTWGLSETTGAVTAMSRGENPDDSGSISPVLPNMEMRFVDENDKDVPPGTPGEILVRGPIVTQGYFGNEEATKAVFRNGWFATGDIAIEKDGKFFIVDRLKELIKYKGLQIAPAELEGILISHPGILEAAVVGVPEEPSSEDSESNVASSEVPRAYVVRAGKSNISADEVKNFIKDQLAPYKQLRGGVVFIDELPRNALGKILRRELRDKAKKELQTENRAKL